MAASDEQPGSTIFLNRRTNTGSKNSTLVLRTLTSVTVGAAIAFAVGSAFSWHPNSGGQGVVAAEPAALASEFTSTAPGFDPHAFIATVTDPSDQPQTIYSDTAMALTDYRDDASCREVIQATVRRIGEAHPLQANLGPEGTVHARRQDVPSTYLLRCFRISDSSYRLFMFGSGTEQREVMQGVSELYEAASTAR